MSTQNETETSTDKLRRFFHGDEVEITGPAETHFGGRFWPAVFIEGHRKGETLHIPVRTGEEGEAK
jgi:hypothetical protein